MATAKKGDTVKVHYTGKLKDGTEFDSSKKRDEPLEMTLGEGKIIPGFEEAIEGMEPGQTKTIEIPAEKAYGQHQEEMVQDVEKSQFPDDMDPQVGQRFQVNRQDGQPVVFTVTDVGEEKVQVDANHPLAGKELVFDLELVEIAG